MKKYIILFSTLCVLCGCEVISGDRPGRHESNLIEHAQWTFDENIAMLSNAFSCLSIFDLYLSNQPSFEISGDLIDKDAIYCADKNDEYYSVYPFGKSTKNASFTASVKGERFAQKGSVWTYKTTEWLPHRYDSAIEYSYSFTCEGLNEDGECTWSIEGNNLSEGRVTLKSFADGAFTYSLSCSGAFDDKEDYSTKFESSIRVATSFFVYPYSLSSKYLDGECYVGFYKGEKKLDGVHLKLSPDGTTGSLD